MWQQVIEHNVASVCNILADYNQVKELYNKALMFWALLWISYRLSNKLKRDSMMIADRRLM